ncbi:MAG: M1 family aminopeptidase, partial [Acidobacteriota bacterium]
MRSFIFILTLMSFAYSQTPPIEPGVSQELAKWRAARYSDVRYKLDLTLEKMSPVLKGTMEIRVSVRDVSVPPAVAGGSTPIILDWRRIRGFEDRSTISNVSINGASVQSASFSSSGAVEERPKARALNYEESNEHLIFRDGVVLGENFIKLDFTSPILPSGSAITRYVDKEDGSEYIYSLFVPSDASTAFPVFDQPDLKATFDLEVDVPKDWNVVGNEMKMLASPIIGYSAHEDYERPPIPPDFVRYKFCNSRKPINTYVFAFAAGPWQQVSEPRAVATGSPVSIKTIRGNPVATALGSDLPSHVFVRKSQLAKFQPHAAEVFRLNREAVKYFEQYFDYKFPFPKYDLVLIPEFPFGGMEHAGATFLRESSIIFPQEPTKNDMASRAT